MALFAVTPGPANLFAVATGMQRGRAGALLGVAGMNAATLVWFSAAALGLGALVLAFPRAFHWLALAGGLYVAWLGLRSVLQGVRGGAAPEHVFVRLGRSAFREGFTVQIANPKALLFFTAVLPPFIDPTRPVAGQLAMFAAGTIGLDGVAMTAYGLGGAALSARMADARFRRAFSVTAGLLLLAAAALILSRA